MTTNVDKPKPSLSASVMDKSSKSSSPAIKTLATVGAGGLFGAALASSGVYLPSVIVSQMEMKDWHMLKVFLTASGSSAAVMAIMEGLKVAHCPPRKASTIGWFSNYDANIIGGAMVGAGMTLTGACPGTVLVQLSSGVRSGWLVLLGGVLGGILWTRMSPYIRKDVPSNSATSASHTIYSKFNLSQNSVILAYEAACLGMITLATSLGPKGAYVPLHPVLGGLLIGGAQAASLMMTGSPLGVSTAYEEIGQSFWRMWDSLFGSKPVQTPPPSTRAIKFALGILVGSYALLQSTASARVATNMQVPAVPAVLGGCIMVVGARLAGGCTSGHGITGMALLSISSIITVASMFAGGIALAQVLA